MELIRGNLDIELRSHLSIGDILSSDLSPRSKSYRIEIVYDNITSEESIRIWTIDIDYSDFASSLFDTVLVQIPKKLQLGIHVVIHRLVEIEMILGDIRQYGCIIAESMHTMIVEGVR
jgi:hypothetical protein